MLFSYDYVMVEYLMVKHGWRRLFCDMFYSAIKICHMWLKHVSLVTCLVKYGVFEGVRVSLSRNCVYDLFGLEMILYEL